MARGTGWKYRGNSPFVTRQTAGAMYENVVRERRRESKRERRENGGEREGEREEKAKLFILRSEAKTYDIVPGKVAGFYFRDPPPLAAAAATAVLSSFFLLVRRVRRPFSANGINFRPRTTAQRHASRSRLAYFSPVRSQARITAIIR